jgi:anti-sigma regulatory factor (Ser/Thr protein kinase)
LKLSFQFPATAEAPRLARQAIDGLLPERLQPERADDARLLASELVSNAVRHGDVPEGKAITLSIQVSDATVKIAVQQPTPASPALILEPSAAGAGGFGLNLVARLADSWGVEHGVPGKVWFAIVGQDPPA